MHISLRVLVKQSHTILGCLILFFSSCGPSVEEMPGTDHPSVVSNPTYVEIAPIIYKNCSPCHRAGESGPFELMTYEDVVKNKNKIKFVTQTKYMPPWPADANYTHFIGEIPNKMCIGYKNNNNSILNVDNLYIKSCYNRSIYNENIDYSIYGKQIKDFPNYYLSKDEKYFSINNQKYIKVTLCDDKYKYWLFNMKTFSVQ